MVAGGIYNPNAMKSLSHLVVVGAATMLLMVGCTRPEQAEPAASLEAPTAVQAALTPTSLQPATTGPQQNCLDGATFLQDLTLPDGSQVAPGEQVDKRWSVENSGSCHWGLGYRLIPQDPNPLVSGRESALYPAKAGTTAIWRVTFEAPPEPGEYLGSWQAYNPQGQPFGDPVFVLIEVVEAEATDAP